MKGWLVLGFQAAGILVVPGALVGVAVVYVLRRRHRIRASEALMDAQRCFRYRPGMDKHDDSLRLQAVTRRRQADEIRREAMLIETGGETEQRRKLRIA